MSFIWNERLVSESAAAPPEAAIAVVDLDALAAAFSKPVAAWVAGFAAAANLSSAVVAATVCELSIRRPNEAMSDNCEPSYNPPDPFRGFKRAYRKRLGPHGRGSGAERAENCF